MHKNGQTPLRARDNTIVLKRDHPMIKGMTADRFFDEMTGAGEDIRQPYAHYHQWFSQQDADRLDKKSREAEAFFRRSGITFNVYGQADAQERLIPFDLVPRILLLQ